MKKALFQLCICWMISLSSWGAVNAQHTRSNKLLTFVAATDGVKELSLYFLLANRCDRYLTGASREGCKEAVGRELQILDFDILMNSEQRPYLQNITNPQSFVFIAFKKNLIKLLSDPRTTTYLEHLNEKLNNFLTGDTQNLLSIWDVTKNFYQSDLEAAKVLAALFQDTSHKKLHLAYLDRTQSNRNADFQNNRQLLDRVIENINMILDYNEDNFQALFYPAQVKAKLNRTIYHFYVPLYLAKALESEGRTKKNSLVGPLMLTLTYEFITAGSDYRYVLNDPSSIDGNTKAGLWKIHDIIGGYSGALFGIDASQWAASSTDIVKGFTKSSHDGVAALLKTR